MNKPCIKKNSQDVIESNEKMALSFKQTLAAIGGTAMIKKFVNDVVRVRGEFQQLDVAFTTLLQSKEKSNALMQQMVKTAAETPFNLTELATGAKQLVAYGFASEDVNDTLVRLGNIASGLGLPLERMTYLYGTTMTQGRLYARDLMQFTTSGIPMLQGLADMYGVTTDKVNEMVTAGKIGFPEVNKVIENLTNEGGKFFNLMEEQSKTITGKISNLGDAWDEMLNKIGQSQEGVINGSIDGIKHLVENYETVGKVLVGLVATYGVYRTALIINTVLEQGFSKAIWSKVTATKAATIAQAAYNAVLALNPFVAIGMAVASLSIAMWTLSDHTSAVTKAQQRYNEEKESAIARENAHKQEIEKLINVIQDETAAQLDRTGALEDLKAKYPSIIAKYIDEEGHLRNILLMKKEIAEFDSSVSVNFARIQAERAKEELLRVNKEINFRSGKYNGQTRDFHNKTTNELLEIQQERLKRYLLLQADYDRLDELQKKAKEKPESKTDIRNESYWKKQKDNAETELKALSDIEAKGKKGIELKKKIAEYDKKLESFSTSNKQENAATKKAEDIRKHQEKINLLLDKQKLDQKRIEEDATHEIAQAKIDKEEDGSKKILMQRALNHKKEIESIRREAEDKKKAIIEEERKAFDDREELKAKQKEKYAKQTFDANAFIKSDVAQKQFKSIIEVATAKEETVNVKYDRGDDLKDVLDKYQNFNRQRLTLEKEYREDEKILQDRMLKAKTDDEKKHIQDSLNELAKRREKGLQEISKNEIEESGIWKRLMGNLDAIPTDSLEKLLSDAEQLVKSTNLSAVEMQAMMKTINDARQNLISRNPFKTLKEEYEKYKKAVKAGDKDGASISWGNVEQATESIKNNISTLGSALSGLASTFSDDVSNGIQKAVSAINDGVTAFEVFGKKGEKSAGNTIKGISGIVGIITTLVGTLLDAFDNSKEVQERNIEYQRRQEGYWDSINYQVERYLKLLEQAAGNEYFETSANALNKLNSARDKAQKDIILSMPEGDVDHTTFGLAQLLKTGKFHNKFSEMNSGAAKEIFDFINANGGYDMQNKIISEDAIMAMKNNADIWSKLPSWMQDAIDKFIQYNEQAEELKEKLNEGLFQTTSKGIEDAILNGLKGGKRGLEDFGDSFEEIMRNALLQSFVIDQLREKAQEFYKKYTELADSDGDGKLDLTADEIKR